jgi:hypothetical protein
MRAGEGEGVGQTGRTDRDFGDLQFDKTASATLGSSLKNKCNAKGHLSTYNSVDEVSPTRAAQTSHLAHASSGVERHDELRFHGRGC